jgi:kynurenine formamidase
VVIFQTGFVDRFLKPEPEAAGMWVEPLGGKSEGWPAPGPDAILYLKDRGIRCVATDAPDLGGVDPKRALMTYWAMGSNEMVGVEFLANVGAIPGRAYFLFAAVKIRDCHGGPGRAIALY